LYGLGIERANAADTARSTARSQFIGGLGQAAAGIAGNYAAGGSRSGKLGTDIFDMSGGRYGTNPNQGISPTVLPNPFDETSRRAALGLNVDNIPGLPDYLATS